jgi:ankyrin repeat protein
MTPIMYATELGNLEIVKILHQKGADLKIFDSIGGNSYLIATVNNYKDIIDYFDSIK